MAQSIRQQVETRLAGLKSIRTDYEPDWKEIARFAQPARTQFLASNGKNQAAKRRQRNASLRDEHGIIAFRTLAHGMASGLCSASRPWMRLTMQDEDILEEEGVRPWLAETERRMYGFWARTNIYGAVKSGYYELGLFATEACVFTEHRTQGAVAHALTAGEYWVGLSDALVADTLYRRCDMTARQLVQSFGEGRVSTQVKQAYDKGNQDQSFECYQAIEPNPDFDPQRLGSKRWRSVYWEAGSDRDATLRESGYDEQPFWAPRWDVVGGETYGFGPGMEALPTLRELQLQVKRRNEAVDHLVKPEKIAPAGVKITGMPGNVVSVANADRANVFPVYEMPYQAVTAIAEEIERCRNAIDAASFADLFNAITNMRGIQPRNVEEIAARNEEKLTQLGPVIERQANEKLDVIIDRTFGMMLRGGLLSPPPPAIAGAQIKVELVSILAQMQRMVGAGQLERGMAFVGNAAAVAPQALDKLNVDEAIDEYFQRIGVPANVSRSDDQVAAIRQQRAQDEQMAKAIAAAPAAKDGATAARLLAEVQERGA